MPLIKRIVSLIFVMGLLKSLVYIAPLGINEVVDSIKDFGTFEYALNLGQTLMGLFSMGFAGTYAYFILKLGKVNLKPIFHFHFILLTSLLVLTALLIPGVLGNIYFGAIVLGVAFGDQILLSGVVKLSGKNKTSVFLDTGVYIIMTLIAVGAYFDLFNFSLKLWFSSVLLLLVLTSVFYHFKNLDNWQKINKEDVYEVYKYGGLIVIAGPLLVLITSNTRLYIEYFSTFENVGLYSFFFRLTSMVLIFYRVFGILLFRKIFVDDHIILDKYYSLIIAGLFIFNLFLFFGLPYLLMGRYEQFTETYESNRFLFLLCFFQVSFWINSSLFEPILQRENKMKFFIFLLLVFLFLMLVSLFLLDFSNLITLESIVWLNAFIIFLLFMGQHWILWNNKIIYKKSLIAHSIIGITFLSTLFYF
ncbi:hypothetical protein [Christiangramia aquimixticola]|uniref:hypothetical protein n=1 Tax=Christiangramia aquimixticola TaxID=1697558 RepID=UPI003AA8784A